MDDVVLHSQPTRYKKLDYNVTNSRFTLKKKRIEYMLCVLPFSMYKIKVDGLTDSMNVLLLLLP